jgi:Tol biopolymer transport system component
MAVVRKLAVVGLLALLVGIAKLVLQGPSPSDAAFPGFNGKIAFSAGDIYAINPDGTGLAGLTTDGYDSDDDLPSWSPDGSRVAFVSDRDGNDEIYVMDADGTNQTRLTDDPGAEHDPAWSADGSKLLFASDRDGNWEIYVVNLDGSGLMRLTDNPAVDADPDWSPLDDQIAFSSERDGNFDVYSMAVDGSNPTNLTNDPAPDGEPDYSPDGARIAFSRVEGIFSRVFSMELDGSGQTSVSSYSVGAGGPSWSPDGTMIAYSGLVRVHGSPKVFVVDVDDGHTTELTSGINPDWQPLDQPLQVPPTPTSELEAATATPRPLSPVAAPDTGDGRSGPSPTASLFLAALAAAGIGALTVSAFVLRRRD